MSKIKNLAGEYSAAVFQSLINAKRKQEGKMSWEVKRTKVRIVLSPRKGH